MATPSLAMHDLFGDDFVEGLEDGFPFENVFSLAPVLTRWKVLSKEKPEKYADLWSELERDLESAPELYEPIEDADIVTRYDALIDRIIEPLIPSSDWTAAMSALIGGPFGGNVIRCTERYERLLGGLLDVLFDPKNVRNVYSRTLYAYRAILSKYYGVTVRLEKPIVYMVPDKETGLSSYFKLVGNTRFATVEACGEIPKLSRDDIDQLLQDVDNFLLWKEKLPSHLFRFVGVSVINLTDVTNETAMAAITHRVLRSDANMSDETFDTLEYEVRTLFRDVDLKLGLASLQADGALNLTSERRIWNSLIIRDAIRDGTFDWRNTSYHTALQTEEAVVFSDIEKSNLNDSVRKYLGERGVRSLALYPLRYAERIVGLLELSSPEAGAVAASTLLKMRRIAPIFALAAYQNLERFEVRVESAIQQAYTAIHPSVQWRFREAAITMLEAGTTEPEPIVFEELYPLYGAADIRSSTLHRNEAERHDTLARLDRARTALTSLKESVPLIILDELGLRLGNQIEQYEREWKAGDAAAANTFLEKHLEPVLTRMVDSREDLAPVLAAYHSPENGSVSRRSEAYEDCRRAINRLVSSVLLADQVEAQDQFPHYFELAKTDGVDHTMYIGKSIAPGKPFDLAFVENLRLRQLIAACTIAREVNYMNEALPMSLDIAQLIVVQHAPITLRFRTDETRFDVDGASGVRFELLKKRLDKAHIKGTSERITQPHAIAVVYSTSAEEAEYIRYADYLVANGYIEPDPELLDVEDLPGAPGLKMFRFKVKVDLPSLRNSDVTTNHRTG